MNNNNFNEKENINEVEVFESENLDNLAMNADNDWNNLSKDDRWDGEKPCETCDREHIGCMFDCKEICGKCNENINE